MADQPNIVLVTGVHTHAHGSIENGVEPRRGQRYLTDDLRGAGYRTIMVGKTHFGPIPESFSVVHALLGEKQQDVDDFYARHIRSHGHPRATAHLEETRSGTLSAAP